MRAALYTRISRDYAGEGKGVERQAEDTATLAAERGYEVVATFEDNDVSAAGRAKSRPSYDAMLAAARAGDFDVIVSYSNSRLTRRPRELEDLIDLHDEAGTRFETVKSGTDDLSTADGRMVARLKASIDAGEAERVGERVKRQKEQRAASGLPMGTRHRVYGYTRAWEIVDDEAAVIRDVFTRFLAGESKGSLTKWFQSKGIKTTAGSDWSLRATMRLLEYATYAGLYVFKGEVTGKSSVPPIIDEATYAAAQVGKVRMSGHTTRKHLLSNIVICDKCKAPMVGAVNGKKGFRYRCNVQAGGCGSVSIKGGPLDTMIDNYMSSIVMIDYGPPVTIDYQPEIDALDARIETLHAAEKSGDIDLADLMRLLRDTRTEKAALVKAQAETVTSTAFDAIGAYDSLDISAKRARIRQQIRYLFVREVGYVRVNGEVIWTGGPKPFTSHRVYALMTNGDKVEGFAIDTVDARVMRDEGYEGYKKKYLDPLDEE